MEFKKGGLVPSLSLRGRSPKQSRRLRAKRSNLKGLLQPLRGFAMTHNGFTLVEIMLVVIIIAALAAMIMPRLAGRSEEAKIARTQAEISSSIGLALKLYELDNGNYPATEQGLNALMAKSNTNPVPQNWKGPYLEKKPIDPWGRPYQYKSPGVHSQTSFDLYSLGKDGTEGNEDDVTNWE